MALDLRRSRRGRWLLVPLILLALAVFATAARAEQFPPAPKGEDLAFVQLGSVAELVIADLYREAAAADALAPPRRNAFGRLAEQTSKSWAPLNALLGEEALTEDDFGVRLPASVLRSSGETIALAARLERLRAGLYLSGVQSVLDPPTRLLIGRHLAAATGNLTLLRGWRGGKLNLRQPRPLSVQFVGIQIDRYLTIPGA